MYEVYWLLEAKWKYGQTYNSINLIAAKSYHSIWAEALQNLLYFATLHESTFFSGYQKTQQQNKKRSYTSQIQILHYEWRVMSTALCNILELIRGEAK